MGKNSGNQMGFVDTFEHYLEFHKAQQAKTFGWKFEKKFGCSWEFFTSKNFDDRKKANVKVPLHIYLFDF